jgi:hypothetical protein
MNRFKILYLDAAVNLILGLLLLFFRPAVIHLLGVPAAEQAFYPSMLGAVLFGIGIALLVECFRPRDGLVGLGLGGAVAINLCCGLVLAGWLLSGKLSIPLRGQIFLWILVVLLAGVSTGEFIVHRRKRVRVS